ncbi:hypothetical protein H206_05576 [Candidatus Electrothrix aarhusensis]|uniref:Uncharacterized protein n=1 Tax=Candidatus Electrothrix aarhusensis TaxID=1859131 RepID=A0A3S3RA43_9BACT|nr:hypothetical protein H206_05576 [Candidatus Electrothrix aarhusensis]
MVIIFLVASGVAIILLDDISDNTRITSIKGVSLNSTSLIFSSAYNEDVWKRSWLTARTNNNSFFI